MIKVLFIAIALAMDALSVSIVVGIKSKKHLLKDALRVALCFGLFQAIMPLIGWVIGDVIQRKVSSISDWIAFALLLIVGAKMLYESTKHEEDHLTSSLSLRTLLSLGVATSIDALVVGTTLKLINVPILISAVIIGLTTFVICVIGYSFGTKLGNVFGRRVEIFGGAVLIVIGFTFILF